VSASTSQPCSAFPGPSVSTPSSGKGFCVSRRQRSQQKPQTVNFRMETRNSRSSLDYKLSPVKGKRGLMLRAYGEVSRSVSVRNEKVAHGTAKNSSLPSTSTSQLKRKGGPSMSVPQKRRRVAPEVRLPAKSPLVTCKPVATKSATFKKKGPPAKGIMMLRNLQRRQAQYGRYSGRVCIPYYIPESDEDPSDTETDVECTDDESTGSDDSPNQTITASDWKSPVGDHKVFGLIQSDDGNISIPDEPIDCFRLFVDADVMNLMVTETNRNGEQVMAKQTLLQVPECMAGKKQTLKKWRPS